MKTLLFLPLIFLMVACEKPVEEVSSDTTTLVDESMEVFVTNKELLEDEVMLGVLCLITLKETGSQQNEICKGYNAVKEQAIELTAIGLDIFAALVAGGYLGEEDVFFEVVDIIERLANVEAQAKALRKEIDDMSGSKCIKCAM